MAVDVVAGANNFRNLIKPSDRTNSLISNASTGSINEGDSDDDEDDFDDDDEGKFISNVVKNLHSFSSF